MFRYSRMRHSLQVIPISTPPDGILIFLAFTGHKGLLGPTGTGGLYIKGQFRYRTCYRRGHREPVRRYRYPRNLCPTVLRAVQPNIAGIFGLKAALENRPEPAHTSEDFYRLTERLAGIKGLSLLAADSHEHRGEVLSLLSDRFSCSEFGSLLYEKYGIETRVGLHCAPAAHSFYGTFPSGTVRISPSVYHSPDEFEFLYDAVKQVQEN